MQCMCLTEEIPGGKATVYNAFANDDLFKTIRSALRIYVDEAKRSRSLPHETLNLPYGCMTRGLDVS